MSRVARRDAWRGVESQPGLGIWPAVPPSGPLAGGGHPRGTVFLPNEMLKAQNVFLCNKSPKKCLSHFIRQINNLISTLLQFCRIA